MSKPVLFYAVLPEPYASRLRVVAVTTEARRQIWGKDLMRGGATHARVGEVLLRCDDREGALAAARRGNAGIEERDAKLRAARRAYDKAYTAAQSEFRALVRGEAAG